MNIFSNFIIFENYLTTPSLINDYQIITLNTSFTTNFFTNTFSLCDPLLENFLSTTQILNNTPFNQFIINISNENFVNDLSEYCNAVLNSSPKISFLKSEFLDMAPEFKNMETQIRRRHIRFPHLTREEI